MCHQPPFALGNAYLCSAQDHLQDIQDLFAQVAGLSRLSRTDVALLCQHMTLHAAGRRTVLMREGESSGHMIVLLTGQAQVVRADGQDHPEEELMRPGMTFGELAMLDGVPLHASCVSAEPVDFLLMTRASYEHMALLHPRLSTRWLAALLHGLSQRLRSHDTSLGSALSGAMFAQ